MVALQQVLYSMGAWEHCTKYYTVWEHGSITLGIVKNGSMGAQQ